MGISRKGTPAPPLQFTELLQTPPGTKADWPSLRGKVVVLEFWATWCAPCVEVVPHLNELVASLDPAKFQFISVDDEDPKVVQGFLAKRKMAGWVGIDTTRAVFAWYGATSRPTTIIVDAKGRIVAATSPEALEAADLAALAAGEKVNFKPPMPDFAALKSASAPAEGTPLFEISLRKAAPGEKNWVSSGSVGTEFHAWDAEDLLIRVYDLEKSRIILKNPLPEGLYDLRIAVGGAPDSVTTPMLQTAIAEGLHLEVKRKTETRTVWVLKSTAAGKTLLTPTASTGGSMSGYLPGELTMINGSMGDMASGLEDGLETPVVDETGIDGKFDLDLAFAAKDAGEAQAALRKLGLDSGSGAAARRRA